MASGTNDAGAFVTDDGYAGGSPHSIFDEGRIVSTASTDHRSHRRVECFRVPMHRAHVPVWVFKPSDAVEASAGLLMNLSDGGLQVLTAADDALSHAGYEIQLLLGEDETVPRFRGRVTRVWTREAISAGWLSGLRFDDERSPAADFTRVYQAGGAARRWVRCLLFPQPDRPARPAADVPQPQGTNTI